MAKTKPEMEGNRWLQEMSIEKMDCPTRNTDIINLLYKIFLDYNLDRYKWREKSRLIHLTDDSLNHHCFLNLLDYNLSELKFCIDVPFQSLEKV